MKKALKIMQEMQAFLAERGIDAHVYVTNSGNNNENHSCCIQAFNDYDIVAEVSWKSWRTDEFEKDWTEFEAKVKEEFFGWWE